MKSDPETIVEAFYGAWLMCDIDAALAFVADDIRVAQHYSDPELPFTGETTGREALRQRFQMILAAWRFVSCHPTVLVVEAGVVRAVCPFVIEHLATRERFEGRFRHIIEVREGRITSFDEYVDIARLRSFLKLLGVAVA